MCGLWLICLLLLAAVPSAPSAVGGAVHPQESDAIAASPGGNAPEAEEGNRHAAAMDPLATHGSGPQCPENVLLPAPSTDENAAEASAQVVAAGVQQQPPAAPPAPPPVGEGAARNFALDRDGAKVLAANPEARKPAAVLDDDGDTYIKNDCKADKWLVIELAQVAKVMRVELSQARAPAGQPAGAGALGAAKRATALGRTGRGQLGRTGRGHLGHRWRQACQHRVPKHDAGCSNAGRGSRSPNPDCLPALSFCLQFELYSSKAKEFVVYGRQSQPRSGGADVTQLLNSTQWRLLGSFAAEKTKGDRASSLRFALRPRRRPRGGSHRAAPAAPPVHRLHRLAGCSAFPLPLPPACRHAGVCGAAPGLGALPPLPVPHAPWHGAGLRAQRNRRLR